MKKLIMLLLFISILATPSLNILANEHDIVEDNTDMNKAPRNSIIINSFNWTMGTRACEYDFIMGRWTSGDITITLQKKNGSVWNKLAYDEYSFSNEINIQGIIDGYYTGAGTYRLIIDIETTDGRSERKYSSIKTLK